ncbi:single stranded DNA binding protein [Geobacillus phage TP-84]|uniref:Single-stranded DNA protein n=1 Tax=Geobacillus phage TP-84 TaxID=1965361 RepID=A0A1U9WQM5_9CAUD|nr:single stranded DNA binding protein [Geobacillus phage TP-84]AQY55084.1 single stranded DNA binding protein [Geobacillus phage TP-84]
MDIREEIYQAQKEREEFEKARAASMPDEVERKIVELMNDPRIQAEVMAIIIHLKKQKRKDIEILTIGLMVTNMARSVMEQAAQTKQKGE